MTKRSHLLAVVLLLLVANATFSQSTASRIATAERSWPPFWSQFKMAINKKDHAALLRVMPSDFFDGGGGYNAKEWLKLMDENEQRGSWRDIKRSVAGGAKTHRAWSAKGMPTKVTRDNGYYFEYRRGKWYFAGVVGD